MKRCRLVLFTIFVISTGGCESEEQTSVTLDRETPPELRGEEFVTGSTPVLLFPANNQAIDYALDCTRHPPEFTWQYNDAFYVDRIPYEIKRFVICAGLPGHTCDEQSFVLAANEPLDPWDRSRQIPFKVWETTVDAFLLQKTSVAGTLVRYSIMPAGTTDDREQGIAAAAVPQAMICARSRSDSCPASPGSDTTDASCWQCLDYEWKVAVCSEKSGTTESCVVSEPRTINFSVGNRQPCGM